VTVESNDRGLSENQDRIKRVTLNYLYDTILASELGPSSQRKFFCRDMTKIRRCWRALVKMKFLKERQLRGLESHVNKRPSLLWLCNLLKTLKVNITFFSFIFSNYINIHCYKRRSLLYGQLGQHYLWRNVIHQTPFPAFLIIISYCSTSFCYCACCRMQQDETLCNWLL
jgi:hypothetical protein